MYSKCPLSRYIPSYGQLQSSSFMLRYRNTENALLSVGVIECPFHLPAKMGGFYSAVADLSNQP